MFLGLFRELGKILKTVFLLHLHRLFKRTESVDGVLFGEVADGSAARDAERIRNIEALIDGIEHTGAERISGADGALDVAARDIDRADGVELAVLVHAPAALGSMDDDQLSDALLEEDAADLLEVLGDDLLIVIADLDPGDERRLDLIDDRIVAVFQAGSYKAVEAV